MKVFLSSQSRQSIGGGHSFISNLSKGLLKEGIKVVSKWEDADIVLIPGATLLDHKTFEEIKKSEKRVILRVDNILRGSRNRGAGMSRMQAFAKGADAVIYQSHWAKNLLSSFLKRDGVIIHNSVNEKIFKPKGPYLDFSNKGKPIYLYSRYNRDELKRWEKCYYEFIKISQNNPNAFLVLVGRFSDNLREYNFDFYNDEKFEYIGVIDNPKIMARLYRGVDYIFIPYFMDACSNTLIEFLLVKDKKDYNDILIAFNRTGGNGEILDNWEKHGRKYFELERMIKEYLDLFRRVL